MLPRRLPAALVLATAAAALAALSGCGAGGTTGAGGDSALHTQQAAPAPHSTLTGAGGTAQPSPSVETLPRQLPGLGGRTLAEVPADARQVVVVTGRGKNSPLSQVVLYRHTANGWDAGATWAAHNAKEGWLADHRAGDLHSPVGVFALTDAGGRLRDPGTRLPYDHAPIGFSIGGTGFLGEPLAGSFDYVVAINYNREPGTSPRDWTRPEGEGKGGGIWFHVDHGGPTHGCVSLSEPHMKTLLRTLDPSLHPVVVMGDAASLAR